MELHKKLSLIAISMLILMGVISADIQSSTGTIRFDADSDGSFELSLDSSGLGVGTNTPQGNLHLLGNGSVSDALYVGASSGNSSLEIQGSFGMSVQTVTSNATLEGNSIIIVDTNGGNTSLALPNTNGIEGRTYRIKKLNHQNELKITGGIIDNLSDLTLAESSSILPNVSLISHSGNWFITSLSGNADQQINGDNLMSWYPLDESGGNTITDVLLGNTGVINNVASGNIGVPAMVVNGIDFDGDNDVVNMTNSFGTVRSFSFNAWIKSDEITKAKQRGGAILMTKTEGDANFCYNFMVCKEHDNSLDFYWENTVGGYYYALVTSTVAAFTNGDPHMVTVTYDHDTTTLTLYIDAKQEAQDTTGTGTPNVPSGNWFMGEGEFNTKYFYGIIDDFRIYDYALPLSELQKLYQTGF